MLSWIARQTQAALDMLRAWSSRHAFGITITLLIVAFLTIFFWERIFVSIYAGRVGVLWRRFGGTVVDRVYGEGLHVVLPFNIMYVYDVRWTLVRRSIVALTQDGLDMTVTLIDPIPGEPSTGRRAPPTRRHGLRRLAHHADDGFYRA